MNARSHSRDRGNCQNQFRGYEETETADATVLAIIVGDEGAQSLAAGEERRDHTRPLFLR